LQSNESAHHGAPSRQSGLGQLLALNQEIAASRSLG
jgi:hypothetical protein